MGFFSLKHGVIPACDVNTLDELYELVDQTCDLDEIVAFKTGRRLEIKYGVPAIVETVEGLTDKPLIHDPQKEGNDVEVTEPEFINDYADAGVKSLIMFPFSSPRVQKACVDSCFKRDILPIGGFKLTQKLTLDNEEGMIADVGVKSGERIDERFDTETFRGYIAADAPERAFKLYARLGVKNFIVPGNVPAEIKKLKTTLLQSGLSNPAFGMPGIGRQGGDIESAIREAEGCDSYPIIGSGIYGAKNIREVAKNYCEVVRKFNS
jgi:orotidine-5'-phosphate decarboxylase